jgi:hypothetical protein
MEVCGSGGAAPSGAAHCPQYLNRGGFSARQFAQILAIGAAQSPQNLIPAGFSRPHREQVIVVGLSIDCRRMGTSISRSRNHKITRRVAGVTGFRRNAHGTEIKMTVKRKVAHAPL